MKLYNLNLSISNLPQYAPKQAATQSVDKRNVHYSLYDKGHGNSLAFLGKVQCDFLEKDQIALINNSILTKFGNITKAELKSEIAKMQEEYPDFNEKVFLKNIVGKCEFCNIKDFDHVLKYIRDNRMNLLVTEDIDLSSSLAYLQTKRNPMHHIKLSKIPFENLANKACSQSKKNPAILITKFSLENLNKLAEENPEDFFKIVKNTNFIYPHGSINGINALSLTNAKEIVQKSLTPKCDEDEIEKFLNLCNKSIQEFSPDKPVEIKFHEIRNLLPYSMDALAERLKYRHRFFEKHDDTFMPMARIMRQIQANAGHDLLAPNTSNDSSLFRDSILKHTTLLTPIKLNLGLKYLHEKISEKTNNNEVYYLPKFDKPKSFNYILSSYFMINNIPKSKLINNLSQIKPEQKVILLDDYIGSGESMIEQFNKLKEANIHTNNIIIASLVSTKRGLEALREHTSNIITSKVISQYDIEKTSAYKNTSSFDEKQKLREISNHALIGGYNGGLDNFSTFYMTPNNNNNLFFSNIAPGFVISSYGIKAAFNTFDQTIKEADLSHLSTKELNEIIEIYKKANGVIPECIIEKIAELTPNDTNNLISVLNTYGKMEKPFIKPQIEAYLKTSLADIDIKKVNNIFVIDNIMDVCNYLGIEPPIKFVSAMLNELKNNKTKVDSDVLLHFYLKLIDQLSPMKDVNIRISEIIKGLKPEQIIKFNILEDVLQISNYLNIKLPQSILKRIYEVIDNVAEKNISLNLFTMILKTPQIDHSKLDKKVCTKWWSTIPTNIKQSADKVVWQFFNTEKIEEGGNLCV